MTPPALGTLDGLFDLLFPPKCIVCGEISPHYLCASCIPEIAPVPRPYCPQCGHPIRGLNCRNCWSRVRSFTAARAAGDYSEVLRQSIHAFKYTWTLPRDGNAVLGPHTSGAVG
jgi:predicted amidophosphoribosyltransferase